jgi:hypothetical protein
MRDDEPTPEMFLSELPERDPIVCELANGHTVKIVAALWSRWRTHEEWSAGIRPEPYFAIRFYCTETTLPKRLVWIEEFVEDADFFATNFEEIWQWFTELCASRAIFAFDDFYEFLDYVSEGVIQFSTPEPDAVEHIKHLSEITDPEAFDKVDDSMFNDQNETEPPEH